MHRDHNHEKNVVSSKRSSEIISRILPHFIIISIKEPLHHIKGFIIKKEFGDNKYNLEKTIASLASLLFSSFVLTFIALFKREGYSCMFITFFFSFSIISNFIYLIIPIILGIPRNRSLGDAISLNYERKEFLKSLCSLNNFLWIFSMATVVLGILSIVFYISLTLGILFTFVSILVAFFFIGIYVKKNELY